MVDGSCDVDCFCEIRDFSVKGGSFKGKKLSEESLQISAPYE